MPSDKTNVSLIRANLEAAMIGAGAIAGFTIQRHELPQDRLLGDSHIASQTCWVGVLELEDDRGRAGLGFVHSLLEPLPSVAELTAWFGEAVMPGLRAELPAALLHDEVQSGLRRESELPYKFAEAVDQALWDLAAKQADQPLYALLGGEENRVPAYASGLCFHLDDSQCERFYARAVADGFTRFKAKVGRERVEDDVRRLQLIRATIGQHALLMIDANEKWNAAETVLRLRRFAEAGLDLHWMEDPVQRYDFAGLQEIRADSSGTLINAGEYLSLSEKAALLEHGGADVLNLHAHISDSLKAAWLARQSGISVSVGNTSMSIGAHVASALGPEILTEYSYLRMDELLERRMPLEQGQFELPAIPGHGLSLRRT